MTPAFDLPRRERISPRASRGSHRSSGAARWPDVAWWCLGRARLLFLSAVISLVACGPVRFVSPYDEVIDRGASDIHARIVAFVDKMTPLAGKPEGTYAANTAFYSDLKGSVSTLQLRAGVQGKNEISIALVKELGINVDNLRRLHEMSKDQGLPSILAGPALNALEINCAAIVKFEVAKRRGTAD